MNSHTGAIRKQKKIDEYECSGPRPPIPGQESRMSKMTESCGASNARIMKDRITEWGMGIDNLLRDKVAVNLLRKYAEAEGGPNDLNLRYINFYFLCEGLTESSDEVRLRQLIGACYKKYHKYIPGMQAYRDRATRMADENSKEAADPNVFKQLQRNVVDIMSRNIYRSFFQSNTFLEYCRGKNDWGTVPLEREELLRHASLPTVHEDAELVDNLRSILDEPPKLTEKLLLKTQKERLKQVRPVGAHGYNITFHTSYNPTTRQSSEKMSCSSGQDSDKQSLASSKDGQPQPHRHRTSEAGNAQIRANYKINFVPEMETEPYLPSIMPPVPPLPPLPPPSNQSGPRRQRDPVENYKIDPNELYERLSKLKNEEARYELLHQKMQSMASMSDRGSSHSTTAMDSVHGHQAQPQNSLVDADVIFKKLSELNTDNDQDILDQHVSRVFSPQFSPGAVSPYLPPPRQLPLPPPDYNSSVRVSHSMKHSKSNDQITSRRNSNIYGSNKWDSGISMCSADAEIYKHINKNDADDQKRSRRHSSHSQTRSLPRISEQASVFTTAVYSFYDGTERDIYRTKIPITNPTLKQYKDYLPKKGNYRRFFFKTACETNDKGILKEIFNDIDTLPLYEGKIMGTIISDALPLTVNIDPFNNTIVQYTFFDETISFRTKIPGTRITLRQFIDHMPKKGNFRYFFKTVCDDIDGPIHEEIVNDSDVLPLFDGIIMGKVDRE